MLCAKDSALVYSSSDVNSSLMEQLLRYDAGPQPAEIFKGRRNDCKLSTTKKRDAFKMFLFLKISGAIARLLPLAAGLHDNINGGCIL